MDLDRIRQVNHCSVTTPTLISSAGPSAEHEWPLPAKADVSTLPFVPAKTSSGMLNDAERPADECRFSDPRKQIIPLVNFSGKLWN